DIIGSMESAEFKDDPHNPPGQGKEHFISMHLSNRAEAVDTLKKLLKDIHLTEGVIIEAEYVLGRITSRKQKWEGVYDRLQGEIYSFEVGFMKSTSAPVEIHHCFEIPKTNKMPFSLQELYTELENEGVQVRNWALFERSGVWSFRSTAFARSVGFDER